MNSTDKERLVKWLDTIEKKNVRNDPPETGTYFKMSQKEDMHFEEYEFHDFLDIKKKIEQHSSYTEKDASKVLAIEVLSNRPSLSEESGPDGQEPIEIPDFVYVF